MSAAVAGYYFSPAAPPCLDGGTHSSGGGREVLHLRPGSARHTQTMFDQLGGLQRLVKGKTVALKLNLTGGATQPRGNARGTYPLGSSRGCWAPQSTCWARRERGKSASWKAPRALTHRSKHLCCTPNGTRATSRAPHPAWSLRTPTTRALRQVHTAWVPGGGMLFKAYDVNRSYPGLRRLRLCWPS